MTTPIVTIEDGQLRGKIAQDYLGNNYYSFQGIPYARAPVGELRFKAPVPIKPWDGIFDATTEGPECPARHIMLIKTVGSEDNCLNLNVYTPQLPTEECNPNKAVMVWIHGGGFFYGCNKSQYYGPDYLLTDNVVLVCINYRLGVLGFLSLEDPSLDIPGNAGLKDMIMALKWVQRNIQSFGGDPNNVTIFGESAGSASVHYLYLSPSSKGLFHKAICQSGCALNVWARGCSNGREIAKNLGYNETDEQKILAHLRKLTPTELVHAQHKTIDPFNPNTVRPFTPVVEKYDNGNAFLTEDPIDIIKSGKFNHVPLIMGYVTREGMLVDSFRSLLPQKELRKVSVDTEVPYSLNLKLDSEKFSKIVTKIKEFYYGEEEPSEDNLDKYYLLKTDSMFLHGIYRSICLQKLTSQAPIYVYRMSLVTRLNEFKKVCTSKNLYLLIFCYFIMVQCGEGMLKNIFAKLAEMIPRRDQPGACHADDVSYLFKTFISDKLNQGSIEETYVRRFVRLWTNFAKTANPTPDKNILINTEWKPVSKENICFLDIGSELKMETDMELERMHLWDSIYSSI